MTFLFLDRVAGIVGEPDALVVEARKRLFREPVRHEGLRRQPRDEVRAHVASVVVRVANDKLRQPLMDAVAQHADEAVSSFAMMFGDDDPEGARDAVIEAFAGNDVGIDMTVFGDGGATPEAVADQVLGALNDSALVSVLTHMGVTNAMLDGIVDEILAPSKVEWSLATLAGQCGPDVCEEGLRYLLCESAPELRATGLHMLDLRAGDEALNAWLDERAMFSSPEQDDADVAEVLRLINQRGGDSHTGLDGSAAAADMTAAGAGSEHDVTCYEGMEVAHEQPAPAATPPKPPAPVAAEPSDVTRAVTAALKTLFDHTKETDVHMAEVLGVPKAVVAQSRKGVTPWSPDADQMGSLRALVGRYNDALAAAAGALNALESL